MSNLSTHNLADIEQTSLIDFSEKAYLDYSMYVILDRALPHIADGLKPVQRRIIYAMSELGLKSTAKYKKSARTIGDVLGKFHPHSDTACYEAMVLMAQSFSYRYPFVDGQGNWGSADDPKSFAAMRYTEARLSPYAQSMLSEVQKGTVDWVANFDGTLKEPALLPAELPNVLLNGASGIAVGMATDIPPHNLGEVADALVYILENASAKLSDICAIIKGPDYPSAAEIITPVRDIHELYQTGHGSIRLRAVYQIERGDIVVTALPYQVSGNKILEQIASQMQAKKLPMVSDLRDESDHESPTRLVITPRSNRVNVEELMAHLFATTDLERSYRINLNMIGLNGRPQVKGLMTILKEWLSYRLETVTRRLKYRLDQVEARLHLLAGFIIAFNHLDAIIEIIRRHDKPKPVLMKKFKLSEKQAEAILEIRLRQLAKLEEQKIRDEQDVLSGERDQIEKILSSKARLKTLVKKEIKTIGKAYRDPRRSTLVERKEAQALSVESMLPVESVTVILSAKGWIRAAKGHEINGESLNYRSGDDYLAQVRGRSTDWVHIIDSTGKSYSLLAHSLPSARGQGEPLTKRIKPATGASFPGLVLGSDSDYYLLASDAGYGFVTAVSNLLCKSRSGKSVIKCPEHAVALTPQWVKNRESQLVAVATNQGHLLIFPIAELPELSRGKGNKMIGIPREQLTSRQEFCVAVVVFDEGSQLLIKAPNKQHILKPRDIAKFSGDRGRRGILLPRALRQVQSVQVVL